RERRELLALGHGLAQRLQHLRDGAGLVGVDAHLVEVAAAEVTAAERLHEGRGDHDVRLLLHDEIASARQRVELLVLLHRLTNRHPLLQAVVRPHVDDLVERAKVGVPEGAELRVLLAQRLALGEALLELGHRARTQRVGANLVDHRLLLECATTAGTRRTPCSSSRSTTRETYTRQVCAQARTSRPPGRTSSGARGGRDPQLPRSSWSATAPSSRRATLRSNACPTRCQGTSARSSRRGTSGSSSTTRSRRRGTGSR